jgi:hypothetical protein
MTIAASARLQETIESQAKSRETTQLPTEDRDYAGKNLQQRAKRFPAGSLRVMRFVSEKTGQRGSEHPISDALQSMFDKCR